MEPGKVQPQLGHLREVNLVVISAPPIRPFGEIVEWLNAASIEQRGMRFIKVGNGESDAAIRDDVAIQLEAHAERLGEPISAVEHRQVAAAFDPQDLVAVDCGRLQSELLRAKRSILPEYDAFFAARCIFADGEHLARAQIDVALHLAGRQLRLRRRRRADNDRRAEWPAHSKTTRRRPPAPAQLGPW